MTITQNRVNQYFNSFGGTTVQSRDGLEDRTLNGGTGDIGNQDFTS